MPLAHFQLISILSYRLSSLYFLDHYLDQIKVNKPYITEADSASSELKGYAFSLLGSIKVKNERKGVRIFENWN